MFARWQRWRRRLFGDGRAPTTDARSTTAVRRVLLVQLGGLKEAVATTAVLPALRRRFPRAAVDVLTTAECGEVFAARADVGKIFVHRGRGPSAGRFGVGALVHWRWKLRGGRYDAAFLVGGEVLAALLARLLGIGRRIGRGCFADRLLLTDVARPSPAASLRETLLALLAAGDVDVRRVEAPAYHPSVEADRFVLNLLGDFRRGDRSLLAFYVGDGGRTWPVEHWRELLGRTVVELDARVILVGGHSAAATARAITGDLFWPNVMDWTGRLTLDQWGALARRADAVVGTDDGPLHLAAAAEAEIVLLGAGDDRAHEFPRTDRLHLPPATALERLAPSSVIDALREIVDLPVILSLPQPSADERRRRPGESA